MGLARLSLETWESLALCAPRSWGPRPWLRCLCGQSAKEPSAAITNPGPMALTEPSCPTRPPRKQKELEEQERERKREEKLRRREQKQRDRELRRSQKKLEKLQAEEQRKLQERIRLEERKLLLAQRNLQSIRLVAELLSRAKVPPAQGDAPPSGSSAHRE